MKHSASFERADPAHSAGVALAAAGRKPSPLLQPLATTRLSGDIVQRVISMIQDGELKVADRLPPERELAQILGVSRLSVRDAFRMLEAKGVLTIRRGAKGGAFISQQVSAVVGEGLANVASLSQSSAEEITEARLILEVNAVALACERADAKDIADLMEIIERTAAATAAGHYDVNITAEFHVRLAESTHNATIHMLVKSFHEPMVRALEAAAKRQTVDTWNEGADDHREIVEAIRRNDPERAKAVMEHHLRGTMGRLASAGD